MADDDGGKPNGDVDVEIPEDRREGAQEMTLLYVLNCLIGGVIKSDSNSSTPFFQRVKSSVSVNGPLLPEAARNTGNHILIWARRGSPVRALLVVSVGTITLLALSGLSIFLLFFLLATFNAIIISLIISLAAAGGFLALFFACVAGIYVGALSIAAFIISTATITTIIAVLIVSGWIGFFWTLWVATSKSLNLVKRSVSMTGSAVTAYSTAWQARHQPHVSDSSIKSD